MGYKFVRRLNFCIVVVFLILVSIVVLYPIVFVLSAALSPGTNIMTLNIAPFADGITFDHFRFLFTESDYPLWFRNTLIIAVLTSLGTLTLASLSAYVFSRFRFAFKRGLMVSLLVMQIFPAFVGMIAILIILWRVGLHDNIYGLVLVYLAGNVPFSTWMVKGYMDTISRSLDEAARIDGASHLRVFFTIILPIARPILIFLGITSFVGPWMDFIMPNLLLRSSENQTLALGLFTFILDDTRNEFTRFAAGAIIVAVPFIIAFAATQKLLVKSLGSGVKE